MKVKDVMTAEPLTIGRNDVLSLTGDLMTQRQVRHFPVVESGRLVGILSHRDVVHAAVSSTMGYGSKASDAFLSTVAVKEAMTEEVVTASPDDDVASAARAMLEHRIGCLPVLSGKDLVGIITESDLLQIVAGRTAED